MSHFVRSGSDAIARSQAVRKLELRTSGVIFMSSSSRTGASLSRSTSGAPFLGDFVEVLERTFGQLGALVGDERRESSSVAGALQSLEEWERLRRVTEKPGPLREVSKVPE